MCSAGRQTWDVSGVLLFIFVLVKVGRLTRQGSSFRRVQHCFNVEQAGKSEIADSFANLELILRWQSRLVLTRYGHPWKKKSRPGQACLMFLFALLPPLRNEWVHPSVRAISAMQPETGHKKRAALGPGDKRAVTKKINKGFKCMILRDARRGFDVFSHPPRERYWFSTSINSAIRSNLGNFVPRFLNTFHTIMLHIRREQKRTPCFTPTKCDFKPHLNLYPGLSLPIPMCNHVLQRETQPKLIL